MEGIFKNYIGGQWTDSADGLTFEQRDPANLTQITGIWPASTRDDARRAVKAAEKAYPMWSGLSVYKRAEYLKKAFDNLVKSRESIAKVITSEKRQDISGVFVGG